MADDLSAQGNRLRARQTKSSLHEPEKLTPTPAVTLRVDVNFLAQGLEETGSLSGEVTQGGGGWRENRRGGLVTSASAGEPGSPDDCVMFF